MYLKSIKAQGFKSFAEKTEIEFKSGITGIVGPNGSGKSNIVDAVKWVLGEQSVKSLRATNAMSDVIFAGSKSRDGHTRAMVSLTFDNSDNYLNSDFSEIEIKRVVYKTGENEYYLNGIKVRLKDITDLFIDSNASKESFNIISQGAITDVVTSKPEDRRSMFESAAGVLKYKKRKEESVRKLDRTRENLERIKLIVAELETTVLPLKDQAETAKKYMSFKEELESIEIALIAKDIFDLNEEYQDAKEKIEKLTEEITGMEGLNTEDSVKIETMKTSIVKLDDKINKTNEKLYELTKEIAELNSQKQVSIERKKYEVDDIALQNNIVLLKEEELILKKNLTSMQADIEILENNITKKTENLSSKQQEVGKQSIIRTTYINQLTEKNKTAYEIKNKIEIIEESMENDTRLPYAVKCVLNNPRLSGVHNIIGKLIDVNETNALAIETALGYSANVLVVDNESSAKDCINYLKDNHLGRATFFPINIIKPKYITEDILNRLNQIEGYIGIASDLVEYEKNYENIIKNQLGNVIVVKDIDALNMIGRIIEYRYRIVSLNGEILHSGGSITGGSSKNTSGVINQKFELEKLLKQQDLNNKEIIELEKNLNNSQEELKILEASEYETNKELIDLKEQLVRKQLTLNDLTEQYNSKTNELKGTKDQKNQKLDSEVDKILEKYYKKTSEKEILEKELMSYKNEKSELNDQINELESLNKKSNSEYNKKLNDLKNYEIKTGRMDVRLDNLLNTLSENYSMTYEKARDNYSLDMELDIARLKVNSLKADIKSLGEVNTGSISEYERLNKRYTFLQKQQGDLEVSISNLLSIIEEMDEIMKEKFLITFNQVKEEFSKTFKQLFKGGEGILKLTEPDNLLTTGIEIIAMPPGKKLNSISLLSGGEKTLTAIALLFAILNVKPSPFCILDEVEAALDESNVESFGNYLISKKDVSQFIIITHKKTTMQFADILYGITMQESGVSRLVSVELSKIGNK